MGSLQGGQAGPSVSVLVPVRNEIGHIGATIAGLQAQDFPEPIEFLLIDGRSSDGTVAAITEAARADARFTLIDNPDRTIPAALNRGLVAARGEFVVRMDAHTRYPPGYISCGVARLRKGGVASVSGSAIPVGSGAWSRRVALALGTWLGTGGPAFRHAVTEEVDVPSGFTGVWRRELLMAHGGWDEQWPINEDAELAARIREAGGRIVCVPAMAAEYEPRNSPSSLALQYARYGFHRARTSVRHPSSMRVVHALPPAVVANLLLAFAGPRRLRPAARTVIATYGASVLATSAKVAQGRRATDFVALPLVFTVMHVSWGVGYLTGLLGASTGARPPQLRAIPSRRRPR